MSRASRFGRVVFSTLAAAIFLTGLCTRAVVAVEEPPRGRQLRTGEAAILEALDELIEMEFIETPLEEVVQFISQRHRVVTWIDEKSLEDAGQSVQSKVSFKARGMRLRSALHVMLKQMELTWDVHNEVLRICSKERADATAYTKVYAIHDLVDRSKPRSMHSDDLVDAIISTVEPQAWGEGNNNGITRFPAALAIPQIRYVHEQIELLLDDIRRAKGLEPLNPSVKPKATNEVEKALQEPCNLDVKEQPLRTVLDGLAKQFGINIVADDMALSDVGASFDTNVTVHVEAQKLAHVLDGMLRNFNAEVGWMVDDDALWVTSREVIDSTLAIVVYNVGDLLDSGRVKNKDDLMDAILHSESQFHHTWDEDGGPGTLEWLPDLLIVGQTRPVHQFVERLLADLRALPPPPLAPPKENKITLKVYRLDGMEAERMAEVVTKFVEPESWQAAGGEGTIEAVAGTRAGEPNPWLKEPPPAPAVPTRRAADHTRPPAVEAIWWRVRILWRCGRSAKRTIRWISHIARRLADRPSAGEHPPENR